VRVPSQFRGLEAASTNLEYKPADCSANPSLAFGGLVAAGLDGIERGLEPPEPTILDPATLSDAEREVAGITRYPSNLGEALDLLAGDAVLTRALGELLTSSYLAVRRSEFEAYEAMSEEARYRGHFLKY
jgi:glutamine synthetase